MLHFDVFLARWALAWISQIFFMTSLHPDFKTWFAEGMIARCYHCVQRSQIFTYFTNKCTIVLIIGYHSCQFKAHLVYCFNLPWKKMNLIPISTRTFVNSSGNVCLMALRNRLCLLHAPTHIKSSTGVNILLCRSCYLRDPTTLGRSSLATATGCFQASWSSE